MSIYEQIVRGAADAIVVARSDGTIALWNPGAERMFGFTETEALGESLDLIVPEKYRERHWVGFREVMRTSQTHYGDQVLRVPAMKKDGSRVSIAFTVGLLKGGDGQVEEIFAIMRDETEAFTTQKALRDRVKELEHALEEAKAKG
ncbi:MAG: PAS domain-containing protein [candidate division NC10 bacterium]|jgi:PAS domain S-box-containing protein|nr:PAS domain-containing protein [candidate division NC10 bacterium]